MNTSFIVLKTDKRNELLNLNTITSATRSQAVNSTTGEVVPDKWYVTVRTVDGKEQRFGGASAEVLWGVLEAAALGFVVENK